MKAFARTNGQDMEVKFIELPVPNTNAKEALIEVAAFGVGIHDRYFIPMQAKFPYVIGTEGAGFIKNFEDETGDFSSHDRVIFTTSLQAQGGSWAEYAVAKVSSLLRLPDNMTFAEGAGISIAGKSALESMRELNLKKGSTLFIAGASGAIGSLVIQLAAAEGIRVSGSASPKNHAYMQSIGLEKAVDYQDPNWQSEIQEWSGAGVDAALAIQPGTGIGAIKVIKEGGLLITVSGDSTQVPPERNIEIKQMGHQLGNQEMNRLINDVSNGKIKLIIENEYSFDNALEALKKVETRHAQGKSVVIVKS